MGQSCRNTQSHTQTHKDTHTQINWFEPNVVVLNVKCGLIYSMICIVYIICYLFVFSSYSVFTRFVAGLQAEAH